MTQLDWLIVLIAGVVGFVAQDKSAWAILAVLAVAKLLHVL